MNLRDELTRLEVVIQQLEDPWLWKNLRPGLSLKQIEAIQQEREICLTEEMIELYRWRDGIHQHNGELHHQINFGPVRTFLPLKMALDFPVQMAPEEIYFDADLLQPEEWRGFVCPFAAYDYSDRSGAGGLYCPTLSVTQNSLPLVLSESAEFPMFNFDSLANFVHHTRTLMENCVLFEQTGQENYDWENVEALHDSRNPLCARLNREVYE